MLRYILRRIVISIPILLGVTLITFIFIQLVPGDYIDTLVNPEKSPPPGRIWPRSKNSWA